MTMCENNMRSLEGPLANPSTKAVLSNPLILRIAVAIDTVRLMLLPLFGSLLPGD